MRLITLTLKSNGEKVYVNPTHIMIISDYFSDGETTVEFSNGDSYIRVLESAESIAKMVEGEQNG